VCRTVCAWAYGAQVILGASLGPIMSVVSGCDMCICMCDDCAWWADVLGQAL